MNAHTDGAVGIPLNTYNRWVNELGGEKLVEDVFHFARRRIDYREPVDLNHQLRKFTDGIRQVFRITTLDWEVTNGGFLQFFDNTGLDFAKATVDDLEAVGLTECRKLLVEAIAAFASEKGESDPNDETWLDRNRRFYRIQKDIQVLERYIPMHPDRFVRQ